MKLSENLKRKKKRKKEKIRYGFFLSENEPLALVKMSDNSLVSVTAD